MAVCVVDKQSDDVVESVSVNEAEYVTDDVAELDAIEAVVRGGKGVLQAAPALTEAQLDALRSAK